MSIDIKRPTGFREQDELEDGGAIYGRDAFPLEASPLVVLGVEGVAIGDDDKAVEDPSLDSTGALSI